MTFFRIGAALALPLALAAGGAAIAQQHSAASGVTVASPWARATPGGSKVGVAYLELKGAATDDKLVGARSPAAGTVELHTHTEVGGVMKMRRVDGGIPVPAGKTVTLKPGGLHIMLLDLKAPLKEGDQVDLSLKFEKAGEITVKVPVLKIGSAGPDGSSSGGHAGHKMH
ncbi:MAG: copper chaperone PCu(A)C [Proteobacteria bacterium]|nr:copper chaperone PCu(A)C [Pseudomonadota bacterium]